MPVLLQRKLGLTPVTAAVPQVTPPSTLYSQFVTVLLLLKAVDASNALLMKPAKIGTEMLSGPGAGAPPGGGSACATREFTMIMSVRLSAPLTLTSSRKLSIVIGCDNDAFTINRSDTVTLRLPFTSPMRKPRRMEVANVPLTSLTATVTYCPSAIPDSGTSISLLLKLGVPALPVPAVTL